MAGAFTVISRVDDREIMAALTRLSGKARRLSPAFKNIGEELLRSTQERFADQTDPDGRRWQPLKPSTLAGKTKRGYGGQGILTMRRHLRDSFRYQADSNGVRIGTNRIYGAIHQFGGRTSAHVIRPKNKKALAWPGARNPVRGVHHPGSNIPARPFLGVSVRDKDRILEIIADHLEMKA
jgi:phage virion morphogenesis protein